MDSMKAQILSSLQSSAEYRHGFAEADMHCRITAQIHRLRTERGWDHKTFAEKINRKISWAYRLEDPNVQIPTIPSLLVVAEAFDIVLDVRFRPFSELLNEIASLKASSFSVPSFDAELKEGTLA
jgi:transcriptional regulator with XRE-family HTH domain